MPIPRRAMHPRPPRDLSAPVILALLGLLLAAGCKSQSAKEKQPTNPLPAVTEPGLDRAALQADINAFAVTFRSQVTGVAGDIAKATSERTVREATVRWKIMVIPAAEMVRRDPDPRVAFVGLWAICVRQRTMFDGPFGEENFADQVAAARAVAHKLEEDVLAIAARYLPPERVAEVAAEVERQAADGPIISDLAGRGLETTTSEGEDNPIGELLKIPITSVTAVAGLGDTPGQIRDIANMAEEYGEVARDLPELARWQMELLLLESEDHSFFKDTERIGLAAESISQTARKLQESIDRADGPTTAIRDTVVEAREISENVDRTAARAERITASIDEQADALSRTAEAAESTVKAVHDLLDAWVAANPEPPPGSPPPESFDINDVTAAAEQTRATIAEARGLLSDLQSSPLKARLDEVNTSIDHATDRLNGVVSRLVWSVAAIVGLGIAAWFVARLLLHRLTRPSAAPGR